MSAWRIMTPPLGVAKVTKKPLLGRLYAHCYDTEAGPRIRARRRALAATQPALDAARAVKIEYR